MSNIKKAGIIGDLIMLIICVIIILVAEYIFLNGDKLHGIFIGLWAPTVLGLLIYLKLVQNGRK